MDRYYTVMIGENKYSFSLLCIFSYLYICRQSFFVFAKFFSISTAAIGGITLIGIVIPLFCYSITDKSNICWDGILLVLAVALFFYVTLVIHPEYQARYLDELHDGKHGAAAIFRYGAAIYLYYIIRLFEKCPEKLYHLFKVVAFTILLFDIWPIVSHVEEYRITFGYQMEMAAIIFFAQYLYEHKSRIYLMLGMFCIILGVLYGSRACIIGCAVFILLYFVWQHAVTDKKVIVFLLGIMAVIFYSSQTIMILLYSFFSSIGLKSRTLYYLAAGDVLAVDTARQDQIWPVLLEKLKTTPLFKMYGAFGDRYLLPSRWPYAHNIVLEIVFTFGIVLGGIILVWLLVRFIKIMYEYKDFDGLLTLIFGSFSISKLMFSSSFWVEPYFWAFLAMLVNCSRKSKRIRLVS